MNDEAWRKRLADALEVSGKSKRGVSLAAGMGPGYLHSLLAEKKDPTVQNLMSICKELGVSLSFILYGYEISAENEEILRLLEVSAPGEKEGLLKMLRSRRPA